MNIENNTNIEATRREIISYIRSYIRENELKENDKLPSESFLTEAFSTNRNTVRSALATLKAQLRPDKMIEDRHVNLNCLFS